MAQTILLILYILYYANLKIGRSELRHGWMKPTQPYNQSY